MFQLYDKDSSGSITIGKVIQVFATRCENEGFAWEIAVKIAEKVFGCLDSNNDGDITDVEFVADCMEDEEIVNIDMWHELHDRDKFCCCWHCGTNAF